MPNRILLILLLTAVFVVIDFYVFQAVRVAFQHTSDTSKKVVAIFYWCLTLVSLLAVVLFLFVNPERMGSIVRNFLLTTLFANVISKLVVVIFLLIDDIGRLIKWAVRSLTKSNEAPQQESSGVSRSEFLMKSALIVGSIPAVTIAYGVISGAHDYRIRKQKIVLKNLPKSFNGLRIAQISDIHSGSFFNKKAVVGGVKMILDQKPDVIFFTGDLVNNEAGEMKDYIEVFNKLKAPLGVYSILGNHDYGDYYSWPSMTAKKQNLQDLIRIHKQMGWDILLNENRLLKTGGESIAILGVENWGLGKRWPKYGKLAPAYRGIEDQPVKVLLSHDPSHWDGQVKASYPDIDLMLSGHTHGFQFGVEVGSIKWSPVQYVYKQWAGLYQDNNQYLYVNRGFGYIGFPGRVGMPPEITILELVTA
ncbi:MAG TPA: metallophosphoesterase [Cytophagaceae bacterium]|jgi:hypothetical protein